MPGITNIRTIAPLFVKISQFFRCVARIFVFCVLSGCASLGIRPGSPEGISLSKASIKECSVRNSGNATDQDCLHFKRMLKWAENTVEAYQSRSTLNRWSIYFATIIGSGAASSLIGLNTFGNAGSDAAKAIPIAGSFITGLTALMNNKQKADAYTRAAEKVRVAIVEARKQKPGSYGAAAATLYESTAKAQNELERYRSELVQEKQVQDELLEAKKDIELIKISSAEVKSIDRSSLTGGQPEPVKITVSNINLNDYVDWKTDFKIKVCDKPAVVLGRTADSVTFSVPSNLNQGQPFMEFSIKSHTISPLQRVTCG